MDGREMGKAIKAQRKALGLSQLDTADAVGISRATLIAHEQGRGLKVDVVSRIAQVLRLDLRLDLAPARVTRIRPELEQVT